MSETIIRKTFTAKGSDLKREWREIYEPRSDEHGPLVYMANADGYVMVRRPRAVPFVMTETGWRKLAPPQS